MNFMIDLKMNGMDVNKIRKNIFIPTLLILVLWSLYSYVTQGVVHDLLEGNYSRVQTDISSEPKYLTYLIFIGVVILEVVIGFIPGLLVYPIAGALFGVWVGIILVFLGNLLGGMISYDIGYNLREIFSKKTKERKFEKYLKDKGPIGLMLLRTNPITSHDILMHIAGALRLPYWSTVFANVIGLLPYIVITTYFGASVPKEFIQIGYVFIALAIYYFVYTLIKFYKKRNGR